MLFVVGAAAFYACRDLHSVELLLLGRLIVGLASGLTTATTAMYLAECAPLEWRGTFAVLPPMGEDRNIQLCFTTSTSNQMKWIKRYFSGSCIGIVIGQVASLQQLWGTNDQWHIALSAIAILVIIVFAPCYWFPESPKFLYIVRGQRDLAKNGEWS